jgi:hypothetical protein
MIKALKEQLADAEHEEKRLVKLIEGEAAE